jgi:hypothetical protein
MSSAWGVSFGTAWGNAWGVIGSVAPPEPPASSGGAKGGGARVGSARVRRSREIDEWVEAALARIEARDRPVVRVTQTAIKKVAAVVRREEDRTVTLDQIEAALRRVLAQLELEEDEEAATMLLLS